MTTNDLLYLDIIIAMLGILTIDASAPGQFEYDCKLLGDALGDRYKMNHYELDLLAAEYYYTLAIVPAPDAPEELALVQRSAKGNLVACKLHLANIAFLAFQSDGTDLGNALNRVEAYLAMASNATSRSPSDIPNMKVCLAFLYRFRYALTLDIRSLEEAVTLARQANTQSSPDIERLTLLANLLQNLYIAQGDMSIFQEAIQAVNQLEPLQEYHPDHKGSSNHIRSGLYSKRFSLYRAQDDIEIAVATARDGYNNGNVSIRQDSVIQLCTALHARGKRYSRPADLSEALSLIDEHMFSHRDLPPSEDIHREQFESLRATLLSYNRETIEEAIRFYESIRDRTDPQSLTFPTKIWKLGRVYKEAGQLENARDCFERASGRMDIRGYEHVRCLHDLALTYSDLADELDSDEEIWNLWIQSTRVDAKALFCSSGEVFIRAHSGRNASLTLYALSQWRDCDEVSVATISLFPHMVTRGLSMEDSQKLLKGLTDISSLAASAAIKMSDMPINAVRLMEKGRGVILEQFMDLKTDHTRLQEAYPDLYQQFTQIQEALLDHVDGDFDPKTPMREILQASHERTGRVNRMAELRKRITDLDGFHDFDQPFSNDDIEELPRTGNIVIFNSSYSITNPEPLQTFIVKAGESACVQVVELPGMNLQEATHMADTLVGPKRLSKAKAGRPRTKSNEELRQILAKSWEFAVRPILQELGLLSSSPPSVDHLPRVFWIRSGVMSMLPLHAAGLYNIKGQSDQNATMYCVSPYAATVQALLVAYKQKQRKRAYSADRKLLLVAMPETHSKSDLPHVETEISTVKEIMCPKTTNGHEVDKCASTSPQCIRRKPELHAKTCTDPEK
ncbi:hypothetical protein P280DRAFT_535948 [Massarina eburnea CBS 473.64]|uniref:CHAT domain-containing protein n=1 Tax=Massarina eburnea CBS 473.64 TaxID=1395130 RepID=A0A6A6SBH5_9PLEO|nr:hypothetical protein P280DRAFT_535948 [Massarina eburnea CBS 473.64]